MITIRDADYRSELAKLTPNLRRFARALVQDHNVESADDLVQATLVAALGAGQERRGNRLIVGLLAILVGLHRTRTREIADKVSLRSGASQNGTAHSAQWEMPRPRRQEATSLDAMPLECREVLLMVTLERFTYGQVAEALGLSLNAVIGRLSRARESLAQSRSTTVSAAKPAMTGGNSREAVSYLRVVK